MLRRCVVLLVGAILGGHIAAAPQAGGLDPTPLLAETLGLRMQVPLGATVSTQIAEDRVIYNVVADGGGWSMRLEAMRSADPGATAESLARQQLSAIEGTGRIFRVLRDTPSTFGGAEGHLLFVQQSLGDGNSIVNGWLILPRGRQTFLFLSAAASPDVFRQLEPALDESFSTIVLLSEAEITQVRASRIKRGREMTDRMTEDRLRSAISERRWFRIYEPAGPGAREPEVEVGFMSVEATEAARGRLTPERSDGSYRAMEAERGLMVLVEARAILDADTKHYLDVQGRYWMSWDRAREAWSLRVTERQGDAEKTTAETGVRDRAQLTVIGSSREQLTRHPLEWTITDKAYLSQPEVLCLGTLLPREPSMAGEMEFFYYDARFRQLPRRIDRWNPLNDGTGNWELVTQSAIEAGVIRQIFDARGQRIRRIDADGKITEQIDPLTLRRLWESKGLLTR